MYLIYNPFTGENQEIEDFEILKQTFNELLRKSLVEFSLLPSKEIISTVQPWDEESKVAEKIYYKFFNKEVQAHYYYTVFDILHAEIKARCFYFKDENGQDSIIKVLKDTALEIYVNKVHPHEAVSYDVETFEPIFYYDEAFKKYDYYTNELISINNESIETIPTNIQELLKLYPEIKTIIAHSEKEYGYAIEFKEENIITNNLNYEEEYKEKLRTYSHIISVVYENENSNGHKDNEILDTMSILDFNYA